MERFLTSWYQGKAFLARLLVVGALVCSVLVAATPCSWMMAASSAHNCCKRSHAVTVEQRCHEQSISSCCAKGPQVVAVTSSVEWSMTGLAPQGPIHERPCLHCVSRVATSDSLPANYLQHSVLRI